MGYATVQRLPRKVHTYEYAKKLHDSIKPIKGRSPETRPLGARRDADSYSVRMNGDAVEFVCYKTPIITYHPDGIIAVKSDGWASVTTHQMLSWVLNLDVNGSRGGGKTVITVPNRDKYLIDSTTTLKLRIEGNELVTVDAQRPKGYRINRKRMNEVRSQYSEFIRYMKGFISLRTYEETRQRYGIDHTHRAISYSVGEAVDALGREFGSPRNNPNHKGYYLSNFNYFLLDSLPSEIRYVSSYNPEIKDLTEHYNKHTFEFLALCANDQPEDARHTNYHKAMMILLSTEGLFGNGYISANDNDLTNVRTVKEPNFVGRFEGIIKRWYRSDVLDYVQLKSGETPIPHYEEWMRNK